MLPPRAHNDGHVCSTPAPKTPLFFYQKNECNDEVLRLSHPSYGRPWGGLYFSILLELTCNTKWMGVDCLLVHLVHPDWVAPARHRCCVGASKLHRHVPRVGGRVQPGGPFAGAALTKSCAGNTCIVDADKARAR